ncbi:hypothetical protein AB0E82_39570 [Streptomyces anulatus]|uniref:hypothetical protein n=1 Tax=Streptomyces anulatus TaxID=1892 RepID=UPI0033D9D8CE
MDFTESRADQTYLTLGPDLLVGVFRPGKAGLPDLADSLREGESCTTLFLNESTEMHYFPDSADEPNTLASALAEFHGYGPVEIRGTAHFSGDSRHGHGAPGMDAEAYLTLMADLLQLCDSEKRRLWSRFRPDETVFVRPADYAPGDTLWSGGPHRFMRMVDFPADSVTARRWPGIQYFQCDDGFEMTASGSSYPMRADHAPPGYWQRTGNQLLPAAD